MTAAADAVVHGVVVGVRPGRMFGDAAGDPVHYADATIRIGAVLSGALPSRDAAELTLEVPLFDGADAIDELRHSLVGLDGAFFLRNKGASARAAGMSAASQRADAAYYRLVVFGAMVANDGGAARTASEMSVLAPLEGLHFGAALERIRAAGR